MYMAGSKVRELKRVTRSQGRLPVEWKMDLIRLGLGKCPRGECCGHLIKLANIMHLPSASNLVYRSLDIPATTLSNPLI